MQCVFMSAICCRDLVFSVEHEAGVSVKIQKRCVVYHGTYIHSCMSSQGHVEDDWSCFVLG